MRSIDIDEVVAGAGLESSSRHLSSGVTGRRPRANGKFLYAGGEKLWVRGVTYGTFRPGPDGCEYDNLEVVERDFALIAANGMNAVRTYTVPPRWLLDAAQGWGLRVMVGLPWEQHVAFLDDRKRPRAIEEKVRAGVRECAGHPAVLCYAVGNEIPATIVRWHGPRRVEACLERLCESARDEDPEGLFTYVIYPSTEYLDLPFMDLVCFNVYLESQEKLEAYLARIHNIAGDRPLILAEIGLDSLRHGRLTQAAVLGWQVRTAFAASCARVFVFSWTDQWHRGGCDIEDWEFGLTTRERRPKPALAAVRKAFAEVPFPSRQGWPRISVVVCSFNGSRTIRECLQGLMKLEYPNFEVIVVNDGSTDSTPELVRQYGFRLISTENRGLSSARNTGMEAATGEIVAYIDDDAFPDPHWLSYLAATFMRTRHVAVGGPNIAPAGDSPVTLCVDQSPGNPVHVLLSDERAEHVPGCNMAVRRSALKAIGGFDPQFRIAGDDVDLCWRLQENEGTLGFSPGAVVWHHRRNSVWGFLKQQVNYGKAEAMLARKWPEKYNSAGHLSWGGRVYGNALQGTLLLRDRIYHGTWGSSPFQSLYHRPPGLLRSLFVTPEWYLVNLALGTLAFVGFRWKPLLIAFPLLALSAGVPLIEVLSRAARVRFKRVPRARCARIAMRALTAFLHMAQPLARLHGRLSCGLTLWRRGARGFVFPCLRRITLWSEHWQPHDHRLRSVERALQRMCAVVCRGGDYDRWDLEIWGGLLGTARMSMAVEEHGAGRQLAQFRVWPRCSALGAGLIFLFAFLAGWSALQREWMAFIVLGTVAKLTAFLLLRDCGSATAATLRALREQEETT